MHDFTLKEYLAEQKKVTLDFFEHAIGSILEHKHHSHERLFRILLNLNTLALTAWVGLSTWKSNAFEADRSIVFRCCGWHVSSLVFVVLTDVAIVVHSRMSEQSYYNIRSTYRQGTDSLEATLVNLSSAPNVTDAQIAQVVGQHLKEQNARVVNESKKTEKRIKTLGDASFVIAMIAIVVFFIALISSIYGMTKFVRPRDVAQPTEKMTLIHPSPNLPSVGLTKAVTNDRESAQDKNGDQR